ncbi:hypothetical protein [Bartonella tamiae]|uniref:Lipoprotein n=1 Tax=Bartonella tamiae Th239 TaxID=1094558 RepID=J0ZLA4_9HYPH|nr:hypothetical protein [Bartonella tamiae]EJF89188.1 hypothetical protein ME5_01739 [Bartonella tamiae Th239]EJF95409.1 hypothetical protein MEG_00142 [Bartonella tamiae Th307]
MRKIFIFYCIILTLLLSACANKIKDTPVHDGSLPAIENRFSLNTIEGLSALHKDTFYKTIENLAPTYHLIVTQYPANILLRGYVSNEMEDTHLSFYYVFDVIDQKGQRLHRINGIITTKEKNKDQLDKKFYENMSKDILIKLQNWLKTMKE